MKRSRLSLPGPTCRRDEERKSQEEAQLAKDQQQQRRGGGGEESGDSVCGVGKRKKAYGNTVDHSPLSKVPTSVIDLTEETRASPNQGSRALQQAEQRWTMELPRPRSPPARPSKAGASTSPLPGLPVPRRTTTPSTAFSPAAASAGEEVHREDNNKVEKEGQPSPPPPPPPPPRSAYLRHFEDAVETVMRTRPDYARLFTPEEREVVGRFERLSEPSKALYVRLFQRKGPWFRADGMLAYDEVGSGTPLWVRRRNAAATADAAAAAAGGVTVDSEQRHQSMAVSSAPLTPFAPDVSDARSTGGCVGSAGAETEGVPIKTGLLEEDDTEEPKKEKFESGQGSTEPAAAGEIDAVAAEAAAIAAAAADSVAFTPRELTVLHGEIQRSLRELVEAGFLDALPDDVGRTGPGLEACLAAVGCCVRSPEIKSLLKRTGGSSKKTTPARRQPTRKPAGGRKSSSPGRGTKEARPKETAAGAGRGGRQAMVEELRRRLAGQQTLWGAKSPLVREIERLVSASVEALGVDVAAGTRCDSGGGGGGGAGSRGKGSRHHWLVAVAGYPQLVFKRALRLMYLTCNTGALSSGRVGAASTRGAGVAGALSSWSPGLSAAFGKTRYASYPCHPRAKAFQGREDLLRWEAAVELRCALDGAMEELSRERMVSAEASAAATAAADCAENQQSEEEDEDEEDGVPAKSLTAEVFVLDSDGELENVEEALVARKQEEEMDLESTGGEENAAAEEEVEQIRAAMSELEDMIAQFFPRGEEGRADRAAAAVTAALNGATTTRTPASSAIAMALVCSRCLDAHLATPAAALGSLVSPSASRFPRGVEAVAISQKMQEGQEGEEEEQEEEQEEDVLRSLEERCGINEVSKAIPAVGGRTPPAEARDAHRADGCARKQRQEQQQEGGELPALPAYPTKSLHLESELVASEQLSTSKRGEGGSQANLKSELELPRALGRERGPMHRTAETRGSREGKGKETNRGQFERKKSEVSEVPEFLLQLEAGWVLASAVWEGVTLLERVRDYDRAVGLLSQLLSTRYTPHRRGRWWIRLSLDLAHTRRPSCALWASNEGLRDPGVRGGDRLALENRASMLSARASKSNSQSSTSSKSATAVLPKVSRHPVESPPLSSSPERNVPGKGAVGHGWDLDGGGGGGGGGGGSEDDDVFEDPIVERERRRALKLRQKERRRRKQQKLQGQQGQQQQQQQQQSAGAGRSRALVGATRSSGSDSGGGGGGGGNSSISSSSHNEQSQNNGSDLHTDRGHEHGSKKEATGAPSCTAAAAAAARTLRCDGVAELSQVPNLLSDESIAGVVLAATATSDAADKGGGVGVPEMSITGRRLNREVGVKSRFVGYGDGAACTVESLVLQHLSQAEEGSWAGWHCEGSPLRALWALLMWDVIFSPVDDVFQTPFQDAPLDLDFCPLFYLNRRAAVDTRLAEVRAASSSRLVTLVGDAWLANANTVCRGINWERSSVRHLQAIAAGLGGSVMAAVLAALSLNYKHFGGGLPDLLLMRAVRTVRGTYARKEDEDAVSAKGVETARGVATSAVASLAFEAKVEMETEVSTPGRLASWLGVESGVGVDTGVHENDDRAPLTSAGGGSSSGSGGGGGGSTVSEMTPLPPFKAADLEGLRLETWLLEVKGPSDRLSDRQTAWLRILDRGKALVGVCHVAEGAGGSHARTNEPRMLKKDKE